jgi:magnesium chelatase subunit D
MTDYSEWSDADLAVLLLAIDPRGLRGILMRGPSGPPRDHWLKSLSMFSPMRKLPVSARGDVLTGGIDVAQTLSAGRQVFRPSIFAEVDGGLLILPSVERLAWEQASLVSAAMDSDGSHFAVVALDEGIGEDEQPPAGLAERLGLHVSTPETEARNEIRSEVLDTFRNRFEEVRVSDEVIEGICRATVAFGIMSLRVPVFTVRAGRALAAASGRLEVSEADITVAARLVLAPRALIMPSTEDQQSTEAPPEQETSPATGEDDLTSSAEPLADVIVTAVKAALPSAMLDKLIAAGGLRASGRSKSEAASQRANLLRGRPAGVRSGDLRSGARLNLIETLRTAAPWQKLRKAAFPERTGVAVRRSDFRLNRYKRRSETTAVFAVDASGSAALHRLAEAKGAVELILAECYVRRDRAALVAFRGRTAEVLLPPTRSLERARRCLQALPGGGGTPLSSGIDESLRVAVQVRRSGGTPVIVILTDGRANIARDGSAARAAAESDALASARAVRSCGFRALIIDVSPEPGPSARNLAQAMEARYLALPYAGAARISDAVLAAMRPGSSSG